MLVFLKAEEEGDEENDDGDHADLFGWRFSTPSLYGGIWYGDAENVRG